MTLVENNHETSTCQEGTSTTYKNSGKPFWPSLN